MVPEPSVAVPDPGVETLASYYLLVVLRLREAAVSSSTLDNEAILV
jgi:hypothetical protein